MTADRALPPSSTRADDLQRTAARKPPTMPPSSVHRLGIGGEARNWKATRAGPSPCCSVDAVDTEGDPDVLESQPPVHHSQARTDAGGSAGAARQQPSAAIGDDDGHGEWLRPKKDDDGGAPPRLGPAAPDPPKPHLLSTAGAQIRGSPVLPPPERPTESG